MPSNERSAEWLRGRKEAIFEIYDAWKCMDSAPFRHYIHEIADDALASDDIAVAEAHEAIPGDSLSTTVEALREACKGVRVATEPDELTGCADDQTFAFVSAAAMWKAADDIRDGGGEYAQSNAQSLENKANGGGGEPMQPTAAEVIEAAEKALGSLHRAAMDLRCATAIPSVTSAVVWHNAHQAVMAELVVAENALALCARWKEANG